ncbi:MAG: hypothetical protein GXP60_02730 [Epsilonproteobacteria bacterium]|nr:hypothetical protein [Campylobacterota bacterium]
MTNIKIYQKYSVRIEKDTADICTKKHAGRHVLAAMSAYMIAKHITNRLKRLNFTRQFITESLYS